ncbi:AraC family transcriptional regulator [Mesorhizobium qingshengii]|nr:helix-turn-helix domain-containing protein [Mesorhizobium qingshengii]
MLAKVDILSAGELPSRIRQIQSHGKWAIDLPQFNCALRASGEMDRGSVVVLAVQRACESTICGIPLEDDMIMTIPAGTTVTASIQPGLSYAGAVVPTAIWRGIQAAAAGVIVERAADHPSAVRLAPRQGRSFRNRIEVLADRLAAIADNPTQLEHLPIAFIEYLGGLAEAHAVAHDRDPRIDRSSGRLLRQARTAENFIHTHIREEIPIIRLCREVGVSRRQLEYAFRTTFGVSPSEFIRALRLNEARRQLATARKNDLSVTRVAMDVGIAHLGRFAARYRSLFGESPKETMLRARGL